jgi:hypothetical protein
MTFLNSPENQKKGGRLNATNLGLSTNVGEPRSSGDDPSPTPEYGTKKENRRRKVNH